MDANLLGLLTLLIGVPLNLAVVVMLGSRSRARPELLVLRERFVTALALLVLVLIFGLVFVNNDTIPPWLDLATTKIVTRFTMLVAAVVPAAMWLWIYRRPR